MITRDGPRLLLSGSITFADAREWRDAGLRYFGCRNGLPVPAEVQCAN